MIPDAVRAGVEAALEGRFGRPLAVTGARAVGGGCINPSARVETDAGEAFFLKWNAEAPPEMFAAEAEGLGALAAAGGGTGQDAVHVPEVVGRSEGAPGWLLLEFVPRGGGAGGGAFGEALGRAMAALHRHGASEGHGWHRDNWIGSLPQANGPPSCDGQDAWTAFWRERRLEPQLRRARERGFFRGREAGDLDAVLDRLDAVLAGAGADPPSLLHGDLWGGNVFQGPAGEPVIVDPAVYRGHREVDLAMSELFGFPAGFLPAYREAWPLADGYEARRRNAYQLYYLLVHVNLFGAGYVEGCLGAARKALAGL